MNLKDIQELIKFVAKSGATEVDLEIDNVKISIKSPAKKRRGEKSEPEPNMVIHTHPANVIEQPIMQAPAPIKQTAPPIDSRENQAENEIKENKNHVVIKSSMIGTFYRSPSPDQDPFISVGDIINEGDTICIIEAMKLFNEIESEIKGKVIKVLADDTTPVEFDQPLFLVDVS
jgi:acetyl-CoA carboxylase biotin carboxyl carrier protein